MLKTVNLNKSEREIFFNSLNFYPGFIFSFVLVLAAYLQTSGTIIFHFK